MADRNPSGRESTRDENAARQGAQAGTTESSSRSSEQQRQGGSTGSSRSGGGTGMQGRSQTEQERQISTAREGTRGGTGMVRRGEQGGTLTPWGGASPFGVMRRMMDDMDRLFENFGFGRTGLGGLTRGSALSPWSLVGESDDLFSLPATRQGTTIWSPPLEVFERGDELVVRADLPGLSKEDVNVEVENEVLTISGERRQDYEDTSEGYYRSERRYGAFSRSIPLPEDVEADQVKANFRDGVLEVTMPKPQQESSQRRRIDVT